MRYGITSVSGKVYQSAWILWTKSKSTKNVSFHTGVKMALVKVYANLRTIIGKKELSIPGLSIQEVLGKLIQDYPVVKPFLLEEGKLRPRVIITRNGQTLDSSTSLQASISEQDQVAIFPPVAGG
jgi:molybdopterin synthase sulfur carrier subunit